jgi:hypothetical protein
MLSPSLKESSAGFSASKSNRATQDGWLAFVGVVAGEGRGDGMPCGCHADSPKAGLVRWLLPPLFCRQCRKNFFLCQTH